MDSPEKKQVDVSSLTLVDREQLINDLTKALTANIREAFTQAAQDAVNQIRQETPQAEARTEPPSQASNTSPIRETSSQRSYTAPPKRDRSKQAMTSDEAIAFERSVEKAVDAILKAQQTIEKQAAGQSRGGQTLEGKRIAKNIDNLLEDIHEPHRWDISGIESEIGRLAAAIRLGTSGREQDLLANHLETLRREFAKERKDRNSVLGRVQFLAERSNLNPVHAVASMFGRRHQGILAAARFAAHSYSGARERRHREEAARLKASGRIAEQLRGAPDPPLPDRSVVGLSKDALDRLKDIRKGSVRRRAIEDLYRQGQVTELQYNELRAMYPEPPEPEEDTQPRRVHPDEEDDYEDGGEARPRRRRSSQPRRMSKAEVGNRAAQVIERWKTEGSDDATEEELSYLRSNLASNLFGIPYESLPPDARKRADNTAEGLRRTYMKDAQEEPVREVKPKEEKPLVDQVLEVANVIANPLPKAAVQGGMEGHVTSVPVPGGGNIYNARYVVRELEDVQASHNPHSFEPNPNYAYKNDRNYSQAINAERVIRQAQKFDPRFLVTDNPDAVNGPPIVDENGNVLGGNSRTMTLGRVYTHNPDKAEEYRQYLAEQAQYYGISPDVVRGMRNPVLVRLAAGINDPQQAITDLNKTGTAPLTAAERAITDSRRVSRRALEYLGNRIQEQGEGATLINTLSGPHGVEIVNKLIEDGVLAAQERSQYIDSNRNIVTPEAKQRIARLMVGQFFENSSEYEDTPPELLQKLEKIVAPLSRVQDFPEWDLTPHVREAISILTEARAHGVKDLDLLNAQPDMEGKPKYNLTSLAIAKKFQQGQNVSAAAFRNYANDAQLNKPGMPLTLEAPPTLPQAFKEAFGAEPGEMRGPQEAEARAKAAPLPTYTELAKPLRFGEEPEFVKPDEEEGPTEPVLESKPEAVPALLPDMSAPEPAAEGEPQPEAGQWRVYHGTDAEPEKAFDLETLQAPGEPGLLGSGIYFSTDKEVGRDTRNLLSANVSLRNPLKLALPDWKTNKTDLINSALGTEGLKGGDLTQDLKKKGYDGVTVDYSPVGYNHTEVMALHPEQVRDVENERPVQEESGLFGGGLFGGEAPEEPGLFGGGLFGGEEPAESAPLASPPEPEPIPEPIHSPEPDVSQSLFPVSEPDTTDTGTEPISNGPLSASFSLTPERQNMRVASYMRPEEDEPADEEPLRVPSGGAPYNFVRTAPHSQSEHLINYDDESEEANQEPVRMRAEEPVSVEPVPVSSSEVSPEVAEHAYNQARSRIAERRMASLWSSVQAGETKELGEISPLLAIASVVRKLGGVQSIHELRKLDEDISARGELDEPAIRDLVDRHAPKRIEPEEEPVPDQTEPKKVIDFKGMGKGISDNLYDLLFHKLTKGDLTELGAPSRVLQQAHPWYQAGHIQNPDDLRDFVENDRQTLPEWSQSGEPLRVVAGKLDDLKKTEDEQLKELKGINQTLSGEEHEERLDKDAELRNTQDWHGITPETPGGEPGGEHPHSIWGTLAAGAGEAVLGALLRSVLPGSITAHLPHSATSAFVRHVIRGRSGHAEREENEPVRESAEAPDHTAPKPEAAEPERGARDIVKYAGDTEKGFEGVKETEEAAGFLGKFGQMMSRFPRLLSIGRLAGGLLRRLFLPLTVIMGVIDFFAGFLNADVILGRSISKITMMDRFAGGIGGVVKGLVGIVDLLFGLFGVHTDIGAIAGKTVGRLVDDLLKVFGLIFKVASIVVKPVAKLVADGFSALYKLLDFSILTPLEDALDAIGKVVDTFSAGVDWLFSDHNPLEAASKALGGIKSFLESIVSVFQSLSLSKFANWIGSFFHTEPAAAPAGPPAPERPELPPDAGTPKAGPYHHDNIIQLTDKPGREVSTPAAPSQNDGSPARVAKGQPSPGSPARVSRADDYAHIGQLSARYESRGDAGAINTENAANDAGGYSYGLYQISTKAGGRPTGGTMAPFLQFLGKNYPEMGKKLEAAGGVSAAMAGDPRFIQAWKGLAADPKFAQAQHQFIGRELYEPVARVADKLGLDIEHRSDAVKEMIWSTAVNSPAMARRILQSAFNASPARNKRLTDEQVIEKFQGYKVATADQSYKNPKTAAVMRERFRSETGDLLSEVEPTPVPAGSDGAMMPTALVRGNASEMAKSTTFAGGTGSGNRSVAYQVRPDTQVYQPILAKANPNTLPGVQLRKASDQNAAIKAAVVQAAPPVVPVVNQRSSVVNNNNTLAADLSPRANENTYQRNMDQMYYPT